ncbi:hypothetical protein AAG570_003060 [Ranatra chinensis]|uniref:Uncharacterized protein n=1 Tax=Ranatra chinensis TaxID=642074 RepID=A0ABD0Y5N8_9HEMI
MASKRQNTRTRSRRRRKKDMDLIEVLWKQDVDMGFSLDQLQEATAGIQDQQAEPDPLTEKCKNAKIEDEKIQEKKIDEEPLDDEDDPWAGFSYTIDLETGLIALREQITGP